MERRALLILVVTLLLIVGVFWWALPDDEPVGRKETVVFPPGVDVQGTNLVFLRASPNGQVQVRAKKGYGVRESSEAVLEEVHIQMIDSEGRRSEMTAETCSVPAEGQTFELRGDVQALTTDGFRLRTTDVKFSLLRETASTDAVVQVVGPGLVMRGVGATLSWADHSFELHEKVEATIQPSRLPPGVQEALP